VSGVDLLPPELFPIPTFPIHENRLLNRLPGYALEAPSLEHIQVNSITGSAAIVGEGQPKPEVDLPATKLVGVALKLAVHAGISWECMVDYEAFSQAVRTELMRQVVDLENAQLWGGDPAAGGLNSLTKTAGILTFTATGTTEWYTDLSGAIAHLRTGAALAEPDLILLHPNTFASVRTAKDQYGRFLASPDPSDDQAESIWGVDVLVSTAFAAGEAVLVDTTKVGRVAVRESLTLRIGYSNDDFVNNIIRSVCEERLNFAIERPAAICHLTGLPTAAPSEATTTAKTARK
jgi:HK97 family phage major capsid protein